MLISHYIRNMESLGWRVHSFRDGAFCFKCEKVGCEGVHNSTSDEMSNPGPCSLPHTGNLGKPAIELYTQFIDLLRMRRKAIGLSQEDITECTGLADGHINKLEAQHRIASMPTLLLWAQSIGLELTVRPAPLPTKTCLTIERRPFPLREKQKHLPLG